MTKAFITHNPPIVTVLGGVQRAGAVCAALADWLPGAVQHFLDEANTLIGTDTDWASHDAIATEAETVAHVARTLADLSHALDA